MGHDLIGPQKAWELYQAELMRDPTSAATREAHARYDRALKPVVNLTTLTPAEVDAAWIEALAPVRALRAQADEKRKTGNRYRKAGGRYVEQADRYEAERLNLMQQAGELCGAAEAPFKQEWNRRGGWTRAYLVPDGHIHKSTACSSLYPTTIISWLPEQSGNTEAQIVEAAGMMACTICYPSAPVEALRAAAEQEKNLCPGSGRYVGEGDWNRSRARCPECGEVATVTRGYKFRAHKAKEEV